MKFHSIASSLSAALLVTAPALHAEEATAGSAKSVVHVLDFGDSSSQVLTSKAWDAYNAKNYVVAKPYAQKCIDLYQAKALEMQNSLTAPATVKEEVFKSWALNDVGTCYLILGQSLEAEGKAKEAIAPLKVLVEKLSFAQCWDNKGWFWKPADTARERLKSLEFEALE